MSAARIDVWSDYVCPFCYLAEPTLKQLAQEFGERVEIVWRAFELRPEPVPTLDPQGEYLRDIWARAVYPMAAERGMTLRLPPVQPRSRTAHEAAAYARKRRRFPEMNEALFRAFFEHGEDIGDADVLAKCATAAGLDAAGLRESLRDGRHREEVLADEQLANALRISGVPAIAIRSEGELLEQARFLQGAQPYGTIRTLVARALGDATA